MGCHQNVSIAGALHSDCKKTEEDISEFGTLDNLFSIHCSEEDMAQEWLSTFVEDCLTDTGNCLQPEPEVPTNVQSNSCPATSAKSSKSLRSERVQKTTSFLGVQKNTSFLHRIVIPGKARSKRKRCSTSKRNIPLTSCSNPSPDDQTFQSISSDPPLLQQAYWLAESELIEPEKREGNSSSRESSRNEKQEESMVFKEESLGRLENSKGQLQPRRCTHCLAQRTPQWRAGPLGTKTLCNACGMRYKSGRLLPEYRPAKSPTFVSSKHSNSHKKVMEMRMAL